LHRVTQHPYRLPFEDGTFDFVFSQQVFEHVTDYPGTLAELRRVLKPGGAGVHIFPSRWKPIESHIYVPFASVFQGRRYLLFWALLGVRNEFQRGASAKDVACRNEAYLREHTRYLSKRLLFEEFHRCFETVRFCESQAMAYFPVLRTMRPLLRALPFGGPLASAFRMRVVFVRRG
jgi:SAM-dependent methyltransferase